MRRARRPRFSSSPDPAINPETLSRRITQGVPAVAAHPAATVARNDRRLWMSVFDGPLLLMVGIGGAVAVLVIDPRPAALLALAAIAMALVAAAVPARFLSRLDPALALRR